MRFLFASLIALALGLTHVTTALPLEERADPSAGYVSMTFIGDQPDIFAHYALPGSETTFKNLNGGKPILVPTKGTGGVRDPYFVKAPQGDRYWIIGTDLDIGKTTWDLSTRNGSTAIHIWESTNLADWSYSLVDVFPRSATSNPGMVWAPSTVWDAKANAYAVFWASRTYANSDTQRSGSPSKDQIYYSHTTDFKTFDAPKVWIAESYSVIDQELLPLSGNSYVRFIKNAEVNKVYTERSDNGVFGKWTRIDPNNFVVNDVREGPAAFKDINKPARTWLWLDNYSGQGSYEAYYNDDITKNQWTHGTPSLTPVGMRHGAIQQVTKAQLDAIRAKYPASKYPIFVVPLSDRDLVWSVLRGALGLRRVQGKTTRGQVEDAATEMHQIFGPVGGYLRCAAPHNRLTHPPTLHLLAQSLMPRHPDRDPSPSSFGPPPSLDGLTEDALEDGPAPWVSSSGKTGQRYAEAQDVSQTELDIGASPLVFGGGVFGSGMYNNDDYLQSDVPLRTLRLAFRYGINAIDTSPYYFPSEFVLGRLLKALSAEYPRSSYYLCTKAGRYGPNVSDFDYSPSKIRSSVESSLQRLGTDYLDLVYLHDAEFIADKVGAGQDAGFAAAQAVEQTPRGAEVRRSLGLEEDQAGQRHGSADSVLLDAVAELQKLKDEGKIRRVGISGYPLPALLRLSRLVASTAPFKPLDAVLSYSNHTLHSDLLPKYVELFKSEPAERRRQCGTDSTKWKPPIVLNGSPFSMGLLTDAGPPVWHPASNSLKKACISASEAIRASNGADDGLPPATLASTAALYGIRGSEHVDANGSVTLRTLLGMSTPEQVHQAIEAFRVLCAGKEGSQAASKGDVRGRAYQRQLRNERIVQDYVGQAGAADWSWASPPADAYQ
ncbi:unnamed protein product [Parajaminaea phylloscopi]